MSDRRSERRSERRSPKGELISSEKMDMIQCRQKRTPEQKHIMKGGVIQTGKV